MQAKLNVDCDNLTGNLLDDYDGFFEPRPAAPFIPSLKSALVIDDCIVTTDLVQQIHMATNGEELWKYIRTSNEWSNETFDSVDSTSLGIALINQTLPNRVCKVKLIHGWIGTQKNLKG